MSSPSETLPPINESEIRRLLGELGEAAAEYRFHIAPNPAVGAAVLSDGVEIARGFHIRWGGPHAEVNAIEAACGGLASADRWDTLVVTLEPCSTTGKTPPCTELIQATGIKRVIVGSLDPNPNHRGKGLELLQRAGIEVVYLAGASPLESVSPHFIRWTSFDRLRRPRPWVIAKWAQTRTGQLSPPADIGDGRWISCEESRDEVHRMRANVDAIVTGVGTVLRDDPRLTVRGVDAPNGGPLRIVVDSDLRTPPTARLFDLPGEGEAAGIVTIVCRPGAHPRSHRTLVREGVNVVICGLDDNGRVNVRELLTRLWDGGVRRVMLEAGTTLCRAFFEHDLIDQVRVYTGAVNGGEGETLAEWIGPERVRKAAFRESGVDGVMDAFVGRDFPRG